MNAGYLTTNALSAWPLDPDAPGFDRAASSLFADARVYMRDGVRDVFLSGISSDGEALSVTVSDGESSAEMYVPLSGDTYSQAFGRFAWMDCFIVVNTDRAAALEVAFDGPYRMDPAAVSGTARSVTSVTVVNDSPGGPEAVGVILPPGPLRIVSGYNVDALSTPSAAVCWPGAGSAIPFIGIPEPGKAVYISARAGAGMGKVPSDCSPVSEWTGNVRPDDGGDVVLAGDGCFQVSPELGTVILTGRCTACCQCEDYVATGDRLGEQASSVRDSMDLLLDAASRYNEAADRFNSRIRVVSEDELIVKAVGSSQSTGYDGAPSLELTGAVDGYVDRAQGVVVVKNLSSSIVTAKVSALMSPHSLAMASVTPSSVNSSSVSTSTERIQCNGRFDGNTMTFEPGAGAVIRLYGSKYGQTQTASGSLRGHVDFGVDDVLGSRTVTKSFEATWG